ncbi:MAG: hypothetical protein RLZZ111_632 [Planctomycetota bacterium]|jgi:hypothetical protein
MKPAGDGSGGRPPAAAQSAREGWRLVIQSGRADEMRAEIGVVVRREGPAAAGGLRLSGTLAGPIRGRDVTLPTTVRLVGMPEISRPDLAAARALFTEPAYWSPELPNLYRLSAEIRPEGDDAVIATIERLIGLRRLGVRGRSFWLEGRRWVPRGVACPRGDFDPAAFRSAHAAAAIDDPTDEVCAAADRAGVAIIARLAAAADAGSAAQAIARWALHPSVGLVVVPREGVLARGHAVLAAVRPKHAPLLVAAEVDGLESPTALPADVSQRVDCLLVDLPQDGLPHAAWRTGAPALPLVARRAVAVAPAEQGSDVATVRRMCDGLQADLAAWGCAAGSAGTGWDWAGYVCDSCRS